VCRPILGIDTGQEFSALADIMALVPETLLTRMISFNPCGIGIAGSVAGNKDWCEKNLFSLIKFRRNTLLSLI